MTPFSPSTPHRLKWRSAYDPVTVRALSIMRVYLWCAVLCALVMTLAMWSRVPVPVDFASFDGPMLLATFFLLIALALTRLNKLPATAAACDGFGFILSFLPLNMLMIYAVVWLTRDIPLRDPWLAAMDRRLGFDWLQILAWQNSSPFFSEILRHAYESIIKQIALVLIVLAIARQPHRLLMFICAAMVALVLCVAGIGFIPAIGAYHFYGIEPAQHHPAIALTTNSLHIQHFLGMRTGMMEMLSLGRTKGIVTFPSFHTTAAILFAWALWRVPVIRWFGLAVNILMIAGTPMHGGHYFVDVIAGAGVAGVAIAFARWLWAHAQERARTQDMKVTSPGADEESAVPVPAAEQA